RYVTGVQTCALPISTPTRPRSAPPTPPKRQRPPRPAPPVPPKRPPAKKLDPWLSCAWPVFAARHGGRLQKPERCASRAFAASSTGRAWRGCPLGTKLSAEPRTRRKAARTLSALNFPVGVPSIRTCRLDGTFLTD